MHLARQEMLQYQQQDFQELLRWAWSRSSFYRDYYSSRGIKEKDLADLSIEDLPFTSKKMLMENFDAVVTDPRLRKKEIERWIEENRDPRSLYLDNYIVVHSSGSSGDIALFVWERKAWQYMSALLVRRLPSPEKGLHDRTRVAAYMASHGNFAGITYAANLSKSAYDVLILPLLDPTDKVVERLNRFQPDRLIGYSSSVAALADLAVRGDLAIRPQTIMVSGDSLTQSMERKIQEAWRVGIYETYATSEAGTLAIRAPGREEMTVTEDINTLEVLDQNDRPVFPDEVGRVVVTNLRNYTFPILRYELGDYAVRGRGRVDSPFATIRGIQGRPYDALPVTLDNGMHDTIHPIVLGEVYVAGLEKIQFISQQPDRVQIHYVAGQNIDDNVRREFQRILAMKGALQTAFEVRRVQKIESDPQTGKLQRVKIEWKKKDFQAGSK